MARRHKLHRRAAGNVDHIIEFDSFDDILSVGTEKIYEKCCKQMCIRDRFNSVLTTAGGMFFTILVSILAGYSLAKLRLRAANLVFNVIVGSMMLSLSVVAIMIYKVTMGLGLYNSYWAFIVPSIANSRCV